MPIALSETVRRASVDNLSQILVDTVVLKDLYKKHHWQVTGPTFYQLHLLFDKHAGEQEGWVDLLAERIQTLGASPWRCARHRRADADSSTAQRSRRVPVQISRLLHGHEWCSRRHARWLGSGGRWR